MEFYFNYVKGRFNFMVIFLSKVIELVEVGVPNLWGHFKDADLKA